ncbi:hypothetical protein ACWCQS_07215 [Streptomyces sp. NPDC002076]
MQPVPGLSPWAYAARIALEAVVRGDVEPRPVHVHKFVTRGTVEERIAELINRKRALAESVDPATTTMSPA